MQSIADGSHDRGCYLPYCFRIAGSWRPQCIRAPCCRDLRPAAASCPFAVEIEPARPPAAAPDASHPADGFGRLCARIAAHTPGTEVRGFSCCRNQFPAFPPQSSCLLFPKRRTVLNPSATTCQSDMALDLWQQPWTPGPELHIG